MNHERTKARMEDVMRAASTVESFAYCESVDLIKIDERMVRAMRQSIRAAIAALTEELNELENDYE